MSEMLFATIVSAVVFACVTTGTAIERPRGVPPSRASFYQPAPGNKFRCLSGDMTIEFVYVNDDYCDCSDGSDEPGTAACPNMKFFCRNKGHVSEDILSSRVNDGICDCCDGSDEYDHKIQCSNTCEEMGKKRREELQKEKLLRESGWTIRKQYMEEGKTQREANQALVVEMEQSKEKLVTDRDELETKKNEAEAPEKEAKEKHEKAWEEVKAERQSEKDKKKAAEAFDELDSNDDNHLEMTEVLAHPTFDKDRDGSVSEQEAKEYLEDLEKASQDDFLEKIWPNIKEIFKPAQSESKGDDAVTPPTPDETAQPPSEVPPQYDGDIVEGGSEDDMGDDDDHSEDDDDDDDDDDYDEPPPEKKEEEEEDKMPDYDEETKKLMEVADEARRLFDDADRQVRDVESKISDAKKYLEQDFGPDYEFAFMHGKCYEYTDREYTYKLCAFDKASQRPKSGGSETNLGTWGHWDGSSENKYSAQKYEKGQNCWNGPDRSVKVLLQCGTENELLGASEPSRCEYQFDFATPARCTQPSPEEYQSDIHDEL